MITAIFCTLTFITMFWVILHLKHKRQRERESWEHFASTVRMVARENPTIAKAFSEAVQKSHEL